MITSARRWCKYSNFGVFIQGPFGRKRVEGTLFKVKIGEDSFIFEYVYKMCIYISPDINLAIEGFIFCIFRIRELRVFTGKRVLDPLACHVLKVQNSPPSLIQKFFQPQLQVFL